MGSDLTDSLLAIADHLYGLPAAEFTAARDAAAKEHRGTARELADAIRALRKPTAPAAVLNLLVRRDPAQVDQVLAVGEALREAAETLSGADLRALTKQRRQLTAAVTARARALASEHGQRVSEAVAEQVEATLTAAMIDAQAAIALRTGLLLTALRSTGLDPSDLSSSVAIPDVADFAPSPIEAPAPPQLRVVPDPDAVAKRRATAATALAEAEETLSEARAAVVSAEDEVENLEARSLQLQAEIDELRRRLEEHENEQDETDADLDDARAQVRSARADLSVAEAARTRAARHLEDL